MPVALKHAPFFRRCLFFIFLVNQHFTPSRPRVDMKTHQMTDLCFEACKVLTRNIQWVVTLACGHLEAVWNRFHSKSSEFLRRPMGAVTWETNRPKRQRP